LNLEDDVLTYESYAFAQSEGHSSTARQVPLT